MGATKKCAFPVGHVSNVPENGQGTLETCPTVTRSLPIHIHQLRQSIKQLLFGDVAPEKITWRFEAALAG